MIIMILCLCCSFVSYGDTVSVISSSDQNSTETVVTNDSFADTQDAAQSGQSISMDSSDEVSGSDLISDSEHSGSETSSNDAEDKAESFDDPAGIEIITADKGNNDSDSRQKNDSGFGIIFMPETHEPEKEISEPEKENPEPEEETPEIEKEVPEVKEEKQEEKKEIEKKPVKIRVNRRYNDISDSDDYVVEPVMKIKGAPIPETEEQPATESQIESPKMRALPKTGDKGNWWAVLAFYMSVSAIIFLLVTEKAHLKTENETEMDWLQISQRPLRSGLNSRRKILGSIKSVFRPGG